MLTETRPPADPGTAGPVAPAPPQRRRLLQDTNTLALAALVFGVWAMAASMFAVALAAKAATDEHTASGAATAPAGAPAAGTTVTLKEFAITPATATVGAGATLRVENAGAIAHNLSVGGQATPMLEKAGSAELVLTGLAAGSYTYRCDVPGHEAAGMKGTLTIQ